MTTTSTTTTTSTPTSTRIRTFSDDYDALARIHNSIFVDFAQSADEIHFEDTRIPERCRHQRWVAERDGRIVAYADYHQSVGAFDPRRFTVEIGVEAAYVNQGIGSALYRTVIDALRPFEPTVLSAWCREDMPIYVPFLARRGFVETMRLWVSVLDLTTYDPTPYVKYAEVDDGIRLTTRAELAGDPDLDRKLYDLWCEVRQDIPMPEGEVRAHLPFEEWLTFEEHPSNIPGGYFIAVADGQLVGVSSLWTADDADLLRTGLTAVRRAYRRRGIAFALKLAALDFARQQPGIRRVLTDNASTNRPMLAINEALGFVKRPAWVSFSGQWPVVSAQR